MTFWTHFVVRNLLSRSCILITANVGYCNIWSLMFGHLKSRAIIVLTRNIFWFSVSMSINFGKESDWLHVLRNVLINIITIACFICCDNCIINLRMCFTDSIGQCGNTINVTPIRKKSIATIQHAILFIVIGKTGSSRKPVSVVARIEYSHGALPNPSPITSSIGQRCPIRNFCIRK